MGELERGVLACVHACVHACVCLCKGGRIGVGKEKERERGREEERKCLLFDIVEDLCPLFFL